MKTIIAWIKSNPISVASLVVMLLSAAVIAYFLFVANPALRERAAEQPTKDLSEIKRFTGQSVEVPPKNADDPPESHRGVTINDQFIEVISTIYGDLNRESNDIFAKALEINQPGHQPLLPGLFPETPTNRRFPAQTVYVEAINGLTGDAQRAALVAERTSLQIPYLNAGMPMAREQLQMQLDEATDAMRRVTTGMMTEDMVDQQQQEQRRELMNTLLNHAKGIHIYARPDLGNPQSPWPDFPLQLAQLGASSTSPSPSALWEGQLQLWILQDLVEAIMITNDVQNQRDHGTDAAGNPIRSSVLNAPIKRLIRAEVLPGYVGLHTLGGTNAVTGNVGGGAPPAAGAGAAGFPPPAGGRMTDQSRDEPVGDNYVFAPTGRASNHLYDVRHARLLLHADVQRLPEFFNVLSQVNLMTVLNMRIKELDEYELLAEQYMYGQGDVVEVELIIETLWLRDWTAPLMPEPVKQYVGLLPPPEDTTGEGGFDPGFEGGYGGGPGAYGQESYGQPEY